MRTSSAGYLSGSSLCARKGVFSEQLRPLLHHYASRDGAFRRTAPPHVKSFFRYDADDLRRVHWFMSGSHNLSKPAWGQLVTPKSSNRRLMLIHSFELSVLVIPSEHGGAVPCYVPFRLPPEPYAAGDRPWTLDEAHLELDVLGEKYIPEK